MMSLDHTRIEVRQAAVKNLARMPGGRGLGGVVSTLRDTSPSVLSAAYEAMQVVADPSLPSVETELLAGLRSDNANVRAVCAARLHIRRSPEVVTALIEALGDTYYLTRMRAINSLGYLGDPEAIEPVREQCCDANASIRGAAVAALGRLGDDESLPLLLRALTDPTADVRKNAALGITFLNVTGNDQAASALIEAVGDAYPEVRAQATFALGEVGNLAAIAELERLVSDPELDVARAAVRALVQLNDGECPPVLPDVLQSGPPEVAMTLLRQATQIRSSDLLHGIEELLQETGSLRGTALATLAWVHQQNGIEIPERLTQAIDTELLVLRRRNTLIPDDPVTLHDLARLLAGMKSDLNEALRCARRAAYLSPTADNLNTLAEIHFLRREPTEAVNVLRRPELLDGSSISRRFNRRRIERWLVTAQEGQ
jgi:HEAT repeat protein